MKRGLPIAWLCVAGLCQGCDGDLLPGERVLGDEIPAVIIDGEAGSRLGASVSVGVWQGEVAVAYAAPDAGLVAVVDSTGQLMWQVQGEEGLGRGLAFAGDRLIALLPGQGVVSMGPDGAVLQESAPDAVQLGVCPDGTWLTGPDPAGAVACGPDGQALRSTCEGDGCQVGLDGVVLGETSPGSDVGFDGNIACWGDAALTQDDAAGSVHCADGRSTTGLVGEHLGRTVAAGLTAGVFDKWVVPARARVHGLSDQLGEVWVVDNAAEATRLSLAASDELVVVGVPGFAARDPGQGRLYIVDRAETGITP